MKVAVSFGDLRGFKPYPWPVSDVIPLCYNGQLLGYALTNKNKRMRRELPSEVFNHEFKNIVNHTDDYALMARFMSELGLIGAPKDSQPRDELIEELVNLTLGGKEANSDDAHRLMRNYYFEIWNYFDVSAYDWGDENYKPDMAKALTNYSQLVCVALMEAGLHSWECVSFVSAGEFDMAIRRLSDCARLLSLLSQGIEYDALIDAFEPNSNYGYEPQEAAPKLLVDESKTSLLLKFINDHLRDFRPRVGLCEIGEDGNPARPFLHWEDETTAPSFEQAFCLQLAQFVATGNEKGFHVCEECGNVFAERRANGTGRQSGQSRASAKYCCQKCAHRKAQRDHAARKKSDKSKTQ